MNEWSDKSHASDYRTGNGFVRMKPAPSQGLKPKSLLRRECTQLQRAWQKKTITPCPIPAQCPDALQHLERVAYLA